MGGAPQIAAPVEAAYEYFVDLRHVPDYDPPIGATGMEALNGRGPFILVEEGGRRATTAEFFEVDPRRQ